MADLIRVLVVDDSSFMRKALSKEIAADARFTVVGTACDGQEGVQKALELQPDVITLDVEMPVQDGLATLRQLASKCPAGVIMVSAATEAGAQTTLDALALGAVDIIPKSRGMALLHEKLLAAAQVRQKRSGAPVPSTWTASPRASQPSTLPRDFRPKAVVIGSSTGGPQALTELFMNMAPPLPVPVFVAQHMPSPFTAALAKRLSTQSGHNVTEAKDGDPIVNGRVYIGPGGLHLRTKEGVVSVSQDAGESLYQPSADVLAASALEVYGKNVLAVMLTGLGRDGTKEFTKLKKAGGWTIAQDSASCTVFGMPKSLIEAGGACETLPPKGIAQRIEEILANKR
ncbi:MAG: protein-glutamate methylesterase/protein-glutamine glutaminase [Rhodomicrobium sp.]